MTEKLIIFDLDGVLCDIRDDHYHALNEALKMYGRPPIAYDDHLSNFDGLNTKAKLDKLGITEAQERNGIFVLKQEHTALRLRNVCPNYELWKTLLKLKMGGFKLCVASNSIRETICIVLNALKISPFFDFVLSNEDIINPKPSSDIYMLAIAKTNAIDAMIIEDSAIGIEGAQKLVGKYAKLMIVKDSSEVTLNNILNHWNIN